MRCHCGSADFVPLGIQEALDPITKERFGKDIYMINCVHCGTTLSCSEAFYNNLVLMESGAGMTSGYINFDLPQR